MFNKEWVKQLIDSADVDYVKKHMAETILLNGNMNIEAMDRKSLISTLEMMGIKVVLNENSYSKTIDKKCNTFENLVKQIDSTYEDSNVIEGYIKFYRYRFGLVPIIAQLSEESSMVKLFIPVVSCNSWSVSQDTIETMKTEIVEYSNCNYEFGNINKNYSKFYFSNKHDNTLFVTQCIKLADLTVDILKNASKSIECAFFEASKIAKREKYYLHSENWMVN